MVNVILVGDDVIQNDKTAAASKSNIAGKWNSDRT